MTVMLSSSCTETIYPPFCESVSHRFRSRCQAERRVRGNITLAESEVQVGHKSSLNFINFFVYGWERAIVDRDQTQSVTVN